MLMRYQPSSPYQLLRQTLAQRGVTGLYAGVSAVVLGNAVKAGVRFTTYDQFKLLLRDDEVCPLVPLILLPGLQSDCSVVQRD